MVRFDVQSTSRIHNGDSFQYAGARARQLASPPGREARRRAAVRWLG